MKSRIILIKSVLTVLVCVFAIALYGCEGSDARKSITGTVEDLAGKKVIDQGEKMKKDIDQAMKEEARRLLNMDERSTGESSQKIPEEGPDD